MRSLMLTNLPTHETCNKTKCMEARAKAKGRPRLRLPLPTLSQTQLLWRTAERQRSPEEVFNEHRLFRLRYRKEAAQEE